MLRNNGALCHNAYQEVSNGRSADRGRQALEALGAMPYLPRDESLLRVLSESLAGVFLRSKVAAEKDVHGLLAHSGVPL